MLFVCKRMLFCALAVATTFLSAQQKTTSIILPQKIRVLLKDGKTDSPITFEITCESDFLLSKTLASKKKTLLNTKHLSVTLKDDQITLKTDNGKTRTVDGRKITIEPKDGLLSANNTSYSGSLMFLVSKDNRFQAINLIELEEYVYSVLRYEVYQSWPIEMHKVQAIASRTYAAYCMDRARRMKKTFDIKNNNFHQVYNGTHKYSHLKDAINQTARTVLTYNGKIALTMFDACCGGCIPANIKHFDFSGAPYLARNYACTFCRDYSLFQWEKRFNFDWLAKRLRAHIITAPKACKAGRLRDIKAHKTDKVGIPHQISLIGKNGNIEFLKGTEFYEIVRHKAKSRSFSINQRGRDIVLSGRGFGHLVGMCQRGARELVKRGWNVKNILSFYYPKTHLAKITTQSQSTNS